ncbi:hypothetical protein P3X46_024200 [Hevea brasiliensis]|uniref:XS domain-containing protein n=1 Tax=Hevea brasiliensis TaxID=3981 RepID=A0ABQ9L1Q3_HEVBR|nr:protein SUPPRESSOR OF GENE SILENCING 3 [Hevea brasiliensis]XP_057991030.1 protein SUPPRESSOR OF GENE SILENCING 3 [Hevea brasiliensis]KAJ9158635.1 hypothetical protein P3X46_024200 [Hevea brasiliensis]
MTHIMDDNGDPFPRLGSVYRKCSGGSHVKLSSENVANASGKSAHNDGKIPAEGRGPQISVPGAWGCPNLMHKLGIQRYDNARTNQIGGFQNFSSSGNDFPSQRNNCIKQGQNGTTTQVGSPQLNGGEERKKHELPNCQDGGVIDDKNGIVDNSDDEEEIFGSSDDELSEDDFDLYTSEKSHEMRKKNKWFKGFFDDLEKLTVEEMNSPGRKWHCPACKGGPGAIDWYRGLEPLMYHAMTRKTRRAKLHRVFAETLDEETRRWGISLAPLGVAFGRWEGLNERVKDYEIVWPSMVVIMNTRYEQEENGKWIGMGNQELLDHFKSYAALKARHSYGPQGHRGMSMLIFDDTAAGYLEAVRLHKHFKDQGRDRNAWDSNRVSCCSGGKRQLYGYMALKKDLDIFNLHSQGRSKLKYEMRSYQEMVERQIKQINENSQQIVKFKDKIAQEQKHSKVLAESVSRLSKELPKSIEKSCGMGQRTKLLLEENREEMDSQEQFFKDQIKIIHLAIDAKEDNFEKLQQEKWEKVEQSNANLFTIKYTSRMEDIVSFIKIQDKEMEEFEAERKKLIKSHEDKKASIMKKYWEELLELEKKLENDLNQLMEKYNKNHPEMQTSNN